MTDAIEKQDDGGRPPTLDENKRRKIIAVLANGSSRRVAARIVGCAHSTITRTAARDPEFAAQLDAAEHNVEIEVLRNIRRAARSGRYWRAGAWLVERKNPRDFAPRTPAMLTQEELNQLFLILTGPLTENLPDDEFEAILKQIDETVEALDEQPEAIKRLLQRQPDKPNYDHIYHPTGSGFAPRTPEEDDEFDDEPSPQPVAVAPLPTSPEASTETDF